MIRKILGAAIALFSAATVAQAADLKASGRISYIDAATRTVLVDNAVVPLSALADISNLQLGHPVLVFQTSKHGSTAGARIIPLDAAKTLAAATTPASRELSTTGRITYMNAATGTILMDNARWEVRTALDYSKFQIGDSVTINYQTSAGGLKTAHAMQWTPDTMTVAGIAPRPATTTLQ